MNGTDRMYLKADEKALSGRLFKRIPASEMGCCLWGNDLHWKNKENHLGLGAGLTVAQLSSTIWLFLSVSA